jgi:hypothetical protein
MANREIKIDLDKLTIGDIELLAKAGEGGADIKDMLDLLDKIVEGGARHRPITELRYIMAELNKLISEAMNPET